eukprot:GFUD01025455.1.p1 GENE.GFUD01025455.1~~GFUD01025455.1.p1  ORF type:complete len:242 (+),score=87.36 GFUD01025455.1:59-784(+)
MVECREIVDTVKQEAALAGLGDTTAEANMPNIVLDEDGKVCDVCTDMQAEFAKNPGGRPPKRAGLIIAALIGGTGLAITSICVPFVLPALRKVCLPYVPATTIQLANVSRALQGRTGSGPSLVDIGSGDGRIVIQAARSGFVAHGVELNRWLVYYSRWSAWREGVRGQATFARQDLWKSDMSKYDNVVIFGVEQMMSQLETKLEKELVEGSVVVACRFKFPTWKPVKEIGAGVDTVWRYQR